MLVRTRPRRSWEIRRGAGERCLEIGSVVDETELGGDFPSHAWDVGEDVDVGDGELVPRGGGAGCVWSDSGKCEYDS